MPRDVRAWLRFLAVFAAYILTAVLIGAVMAHCAVAAPKLQRGELELLARVVQRESTGESLAGQKAVAWTVINRLKDPEVYGATISAVLRRPHQYAAPAAGPDTSPAYLRALHASLEAWLSIGGDPSNGAQYFFVCTMKRPPAWARRMPRVATIGSHCFHKRD